MKSSKIAERYSFARNVLSCANKKQRNKYIKMASPEQVNALMECVRNACEGNIPFSEEEFKALKPFQKQFKKLISKRRSTQRQRKLLVQEGGFLPLLAGALLPVFAEFVLKS